MGECKSCGAWLTRAEACTRCGAPRSSLVAGRGVAAERLAHRQTREELERRLEVMDRNLDALDPLSRWRGEPRIDWASPSVLASLAALAVGLAGAIAWHPAWGFVAACGAMLLGAGVHSIAELRAVHAKDALVSLANAQDINRLRADIAAHQDMLDQLDGEDS